MLSKVFLIACLGEMNLVGLFVTAVSALARMPDPVSGNFTGPILPKRLRIAKDRIMSNETDSRSFDRPQQNELNMWS
jgi:hypothetical protein